MNWFWSLVMLSAAIYCAAQGFRDFRRKQYVAAAIGAALTVAILAIPFPNQTVTVDLPVPAR